MIQFTIEMVHFVGELIGNAGNLEVVGKYRNPECYNQKTSKWLSRSHVRIHFDMWLYLPEFIRYYPKGCSYLFCMYVRSFTSPYFLFSIKTHKVTKKILLLFKICSKKCTNTNSNRMSQNDQNLEFMVSFQSHILMDGLDT